MKVCDESLYHEIAVIYRFINLYERMETMEGEALDFITREKGEENKEGSLRKR